MDFVLFVELLDLPSADLSTEIRVEQCCSLDKNKIVEIAASPARNRVLANLASH